MTDDRTRRTSGRRCETTRTRALARDGRFSLFLSDARFFAFARASSSVRGVDADRWMDRSVRGGGVRARVCARAVEREDGRAWIGG